MAQKVAPPGGGEENKASRGDSRRQVRNNGTLVHIANDWRTKWHLDMRYADATPEDLIRDMADIHTHIRLKAITTCARAAEYRPPPEPGIRLEQDPEKTNAMKLLPVELFVGLECCLDDDHSRVKRAAAIALYTLEKPVPKAEKILRTTLKEKKSVDRWTAAQCLAYYGECDSDVVGELIWQLLHTEDSIRTEQAGFLLAKLSENSTLVHSMIAEQLNNSSWRYRILACKVIPKLHGAINKDLVHKLTHLMWMDWHAEVRIAAAQTLGRTGHGKDVHNQLVAKIQDPNERTRVEAVSKVGYLGIMTAKLLNPFIECFHDNYVSVRIEVCIACGNLKIGDPDILQQLVYLATYDPIWKVKALAIQALGHIGGEVTESVREAVLWAFRYEEHEAVRAEACHTIVVLKLMEDDVAEILQNRSLVESSQLVKDEIIAALEMFGISPTEDMDMVAKIKGEVRKLCTKANIAAQITLSDREDEMRANITRMIHMGPEEKKELEQTPRYRPLHELVRPGTGSAGSRPWTADDSSSLRPTSRESRGTAGADREIQDIISRSRQQGLLSAGVDSSSSDVRSAGSHGSVRSAGSRGSVRSAGSSNHDDNDLTMDDTSDVASIASRPSSRPRSQLQALPEEEEEEDLPEEEEEDLPEEEEEEDAGQKQEKEDDEMPATAVPFNDQQTYIEVVAGANSPQHTAARSTTQSQRSRSDAGGSVSKEWESRSNGGGTSSVPSMDRNKNSNSKSTEVEDIDTEIVEHASGENGECKDMDDRDCASSTSPDAEDACSQVEDVGKDR